MLNTTSIYGYITNEHGEIVNKCVVEKITPMLEGFKFIRVMNREELDSIVVIEKQEPIKITIEQRIVELENKIKLIEEKLK